MATKAYFYAIGRRKTSRATVKLFPGGKGDITVNGETLRDWADDAEMMHVMQQPLVLLGLQKDVDLEIRVSGGGKKAQADSALLGISRAILKQDAKLRQQLKEEGFLTRDPRVKERKKPGLKRARRAPQFSKR